MAAISRRQRNRSLPKSSRWFCGIVQLRPACHRSSYVHLWRAKIRIAPCRRLPVIDWLSSLPLWLFF